MGAAPGAWELEVSAAADHPFLDGPSGAVSLYPFVLVGDRLEELRLFDGLTRDHEAVHVSSVRMVVSPDHEADYYDDLLRALAVDR